MAHILIVEDNVDLAASLAHNLRLEGYEVRVAEEGRSGITIAHDWPADLVILDLMLPGIDGFEVLHSLRGNGSRMPVIILSARGEESDKVRGFRLDADQYVTKPFGVLELIERVRMLLRRASATNGNGIIRFGTVVVDPTTHTVTRDGDSVALTPKAFALLLALVRRKGAVASRAELLREVWGYGSFVLTRTVDSHIAELRRKLEEDPAEPRHIVTVWTVGYRFVP